MARFSRRPQCGLTGLGTGANQAILYGSSRDVWPISDTMLLVTGNRGALDAALMQGAVFCFWPPAAGGGDVSEGT